MVFSEEVMKLLHEYKRILKRYVAPEERETKIESLGLTRKDIRDAKDVDLYRKAQQVIKDILSTVNKSSDTPTAYYGLEEFGQHLKLFIQAYQIDVDSRGHEKVIHAQRLASRATVDAIQLLKLSPEKLTNKHLQQLDDCFQIVAKYGIKEQQALLMKALRNRNQEWHKQSMSPLLNSFKNYMQAKAMSVESRASE